MIMTERYVNEQELKNEACLLPSDMTEKEQIDFCARFRDRYGIDDYEDISFLCEHLAKYLKCYACLDNYENISDTEHNLLMTIASTLDAYSTTFDRLFHEY